MIECGCLAIQTVQIIMEMGSKVDEWSLKHTVFDMDNADITTCHISTSTNSWVDGRPYVEQRTEETTSGISLIIIKYSGNSKIKIANNKCQLK